MLIESILGVASGLIGNVVTTVSNNRAQKQKNAHELAMRRLELDAMRQEAELNIKVTEAQMAAEVERLEAQAYATATAQADTRELDKAAIPELFKSRWTAWLGALLTFLLGFVDFLKGIMRPGLTLYLTAVTSWLTFKAYELLSLRGEAITAEMAVDIFKGNVDTVTYLTVSVITWWFADRRTAKFALRLNDGNFRK